MEKLEKKENETFEFKESVPIIQEVKNSWLDELYIKSWKKEKKNGLNMNELLTKFIEPENPKWFYLNTKNIQNPSVRIKCWKLIREVILSIYKGIIFKHTNK